MICSRGLRQLPPAVDAGFRLLSFPTTTTTTTAASPIATAAAAAAVVLSAAAAAAARGPPAAAPAPADARPPDGVAFGVADVAGVGAQLAGGLRRRRPVLCVVVVGRRRRQRRPDGAADVGRRQRPDVGHPSAADGQSDVEQRRRQSQRRRGQLLLRAGPVQPGWLLQRLGRRPRQSAAPEKDAQVAQSRTRRLSRHRQKEKPRRSASFSPAHHFLLLFAFAFSFSLISRLGFALAVDLIG